MPKRWHEHVKDHFVPHEGNGYRPKILATEVVVGLLLLTIFVEGAYVIEKEVAFKNTGFLASVLPGVLISLTNADRADNGAGELQENDVLAAAAKLKAEDMAAKGYFSHVTPDGKQPWYWIEQTGYAYEYAGENLAVNFEDSKDVEEAWMNSPTHRANIVKPVYTEVGIATAKGTYKGKDATFVVQFFASPKALAAITPTPQAAPEEPAVAAPEPSSEDPSVLGEESPRPIAQVAPALVPDQLPSAEVSPTPLEKAAASPTHTVAILLSILAGAVGILLLLAFIAHLKAPYVEALAGSFALLVVVVGLMAFNALGTPSLELPQDGQSASVRAAF